MQVLVLGASGLLGRSIGDELLARGHAVLGVSRSGTGSARLITEGSVRRADLTTATDDALDDVFTGAQAVVYCLGPDDRAPLAAPVTATLGRLLVDTTVRAVRAARRQQVRQVVILGSYFATFDRLHPEWGLRARHPYISARVDQTVHAERAGEEGTVSVLEIPFVFGAVPGVTPLWKDTLFDRLRRWPIAACVGGGTAAVTHTDVARAAAAIIEGAVPPGRYPLAVDNLTYRHLWQVVLAAMGRTVPVVTVPAPLVTAGVLAGSLGYRLRGQAMGLGPRHVVRDILDRHLYLDPVVHSAALGLVPGNLDEAVRETVRAAYPPQPPSSAATRDT